MERLKQAVNNLSIRMSFILYIVLFLCLDILLCLGTAALLQKTAESVYNSLVGPMAIIYSVLCILGAAFLFYNRKIKKPVSLIKNASEKIIRQDLDFSLSYGQRDEMGDLCDAFESMRAALLENNRSMWRQTEERHRVNRAFAHDMRTPLTILKGYLEIFELQSGKLTAEAIQENALVMKKHLHRIERYVNAMNSLQKIEDIRPEQKRISPQALADEAEQTAAMLCGQAGKAFHIKNLLSEAELAFDFDIVLQVLGNLISNAARYARTKVTLELRYDEGFLILEVCDDGPGFSQQALQNAADPFYTESENQSDYGLGLYISRLLCGSHKGSLDICNHESGGKVTAKFLKQIKT